VTSTSAPTSKKKTLTQEERKKQVEASTEYYKSQKEAKPGSLAAKARMVEQFNEKNKKK
jgi:YidC/Oxa1 family membrane protein insertase